MNDSNLNLSYPPDFIEDNSIDLNEWSNYAKGGIFMSGTSHLSLHFHGASRTVSDFITDVTNTNLISSKKSSK
ncbi:hypothetical protein RDI58_010427 [Solanum bulbocastanum]|uniref:Uncharacterized protein n=1 Tax=Solanum bulbocastanum TaxID=147425 RepID=A0AAN8TWE6_SOLBU